MFSCAKKWLESQKFGKKFNARSLPFLTTDGAQASHKQRRALFNQNNNHFECAVTLHLEASKARETCENDSLIPDNLPLTPEPLMGHRRSAERRGRRAEFQKL